MECSEVEDSYIDELIEKHEKQQLIFLLKLLFSAILVGSSIISILYM
jgi:hypothetical protein